MASQILIRVSAVGAAVLTAVLCSAGPAVAAQPLSPIVAAADPAQPSTPAERAAAAIRPAIAYIDITVSGYVINESGDGFAGPDGNPIFNNGQPIVIPATCTGFGVSPDGYVATAGHCVDTTSDTARGWHAELIKAAAATAKSTDPSTASMTPDQILDQGMKDWTVEGTTKGSPPDITFSVISEATSTGATATPGAPQAPPAAPGQAPPASLGPALPARLVDFRSPEQGDVALLKIEASDLPAALLATDADAQVGASVLSVGYPAAADAQTDPSLEPSDKDGQISSKRTVGSVPVYETSAGLLPGMSGGPTIDLDGRVLGVNSSYFTGGQPFNFIAPSAGLSELLAGNGVRNELGQADVTYRAALDSYYAGHYTDAIAGFDRVLQTHPQYAQATQFRLLAARARDTLGDTPQARNGYFGLPPVAFWSLLGGGGALLLIGGAVAAIRLARRRRPVPSAMIPTQRSDDALPGGPTDGGQPAERASATAATAGSHAGVRGPNSPVDDRGLSTFGLPPLAGQDVSSGSSDA